MYLTAERSKWLVLSIAGLDKGFAGAVQQDLETLGAVRMNGDFCFLPQDLEVPDQLCSLQREVADAGGEMIVLRAEPLELRHERELITRFNRERDRQYRALLAYCEAFRAEICQDIALYRFIHAELATDDDKLDDLRCRLARIERLDVFGSALASKARHSLQRCEALLEVPARQQIS